MSFFQKLRAKLTRSSAAIETKIDEIVGQGAEEAEENEEIASADIASEPVLPASFEGENRSASKGFLGHLAKRKTAPRRRLNDAMIESLEEALIATDIGVETSLKIVANIAEGRLNKAISTAEIKALLSAEIAKILTPIAQPMPIFSSRPQVVLVVGVNGAGKTTTIGKLAAQLQNDGKSVLIAAGDTFRAAATEQLEIWAKRANVSVLVAPPGTDPASLVFDALVQAERENYDLLMIDTAGRLQNRQDLMDELAKIIRVIKKQYPEAPHNTLLVLDATTGQNALSQVKSFQEMANISGLVMTKLDGTAKGGVLVALADRYALPVHAIGLGEQIDDLAPFDPQEFSDALTGNVT